MRISDVLRTKSNDVVTVEPTSTVRELVAVLGQHNIGAVVVCTADDAVVGIVSERDIVRNLTNGVDVLDEPVSAIMTTELHTAHPDQTVHELAKLMTEHRVRHVPVIVGSTLQGIVSIGDVVKSRIGELEFERDQLSSYVANSQ